MQFRIDMTDHVEYTQGGFDNYDDEYHTYTYNHAVVTDREYGDVALFPGEVEPAVGDDIHLVVASFDTGDSLSSEYGHHTMLWAFTDAAKAEELKALVELDDVTCPEDQFHLKLEFEGVPIARCWAGYHESLNGAHVIKLEVH